MRAGHGTLYVDETLDADLSISATEIIGIMIASVELRQQAWI
jgi:hypothetical protein